MDLLNDFPPEPASAAGQAATAGAAAAAAAGEAWEIATAASGEPLGSPTATQVSYRLEGPPDTRPVSPTARGPEKRRV